MHLPFLTRFVRVFVWCTVLFSSVVISAQQEFSEEPDFDISAPIDTTEPNFVPKGVSARYSPITDAVVRERLNGLSGCLRLQTNAVVRSYIRHYVFTKPDKTRLMLGRRLTYFPLFERKLKEHGLPEDLKYLAVVESALNSKAVSRVGASGLWQFMPYTGSDYGLRQTGTVDERNNAVESTEAAMKYLSHLYTQYRDWALALAAYNSGPTRVTAAIRRAGSRNFWVIQRYLPEETRNYVPAFIAATYICNYYQMHGIEPTYPNLEEQLTMHMKVYEGMSFRDIARATGADMNTIRNLNTGYRREYIPPSTEGQYVMLPQRVIPAFIRYLNGLSPRVYELPEGMEYVSGGGSGDGRYYEVAIAAPKDGSLDELADQLGMTTDHLVAWNSISSYQYVRMGQLLKVWRPIMVQMHSSDRIEPPASAFSAGTPTPAPNTSAPLGKVVANVSAPSLAAPAKPVQYQWHTLGRTEALEDVARQYNVPLEHLRRLNEGQNLTPGAKIKVKTL